MACWYCLFFDSGGAGGKGTWGKLVEVYDDGPARDSKDPNYDSEEEVRITKKEKEHLLLLLIRNTL